MNLHHSTFKNSREEQQNRQGAVMVLAIGLLIMLFAFTALAVDIGYITLTRAELQKSADAAALAANLELYSGWGVAKTKTSSEVAAAARNAAVAVASQNEAGGLSSTFIDPNVDVRLGHRQWSEDAEKWGINWGVTPYNVVEVTVRRNNYGSANGDLPLGLWFAPVIGPENAVLKVSSIAALRPAGAVRKIPGMTVGILPFTLDVGTWGALMDDMMKDKVGQDKYSYDPKTGMVSNGDDGKLEVDLYPYGNPDLPPGNRGTVDFGHFGNSTADITRQILYGLNATDLSYYPDSKIDLINDLPMDVSGDTGISAGFEEQLKEIIGEPRMLPLFDYVSGPGENAVYHVVKFVPVQIVYVKLSGKPSSKKVFIQPATFFDPTVVAGDTEITEDSILTSAAIVQ